MRPLVALVLTLLLVLGTDTPAGALTAPAGTPSATTFAGTPTVGPLFRDTLAAGHSCTTSVIASAHHDLVLTAAHCVVGTAVGWSVAPGYRDGATPYGVWAVAAAYVPPRWTATRDWHYDYAILRLAKHRRNGSWVGVQDVTGANALGTAPGSGVRITDDAYNAGVGDRPVTCTTRTYYLYGYPSFDCHGYVGGSSGSPWLHGRTVVGVIGGLHHGGCYEFASRSSRFLADVYQLLARASREGAGDTVPAPGTDGC